MISKIGQRKGCKLIAYVLIALLTIPSSINYLGLTKIYAQEEVEENAKFKLALIDLQDVSTAKVKNLDKKATDALYLSLTASGYFELIEPSVVKKAISDAGITGVLDTMGLLKIGKALKVDGIITGRLEKVKMSTDKLECSTQIFIQLYQIPSVQIMGKVLAYGTSGEKPGYAASSDLLISEAITNTANLATDELLRNLQTEGMVLSPRGDKVLVNLGKFNNINPGAEFGVWWGEELIARLKAKKVDNRESETKIVYRKPGISLQSGDKVTIIYNPPQKVKVAKERREKRKRYTPLIIGAVVIAAMVLLTGKKKKVEAAETADISSIKVTGVKVSPSKDPTTGDLYMIVNWDTVEDPNVTGYYVYRAAGNEEGPTESYSLVHDTQGEAGVPPWYDYGNNAKTKQKGEIKGKLIEGVTYWYKIAAHDAMGRAGPLSSTTTDSKAKAGELAEPKPPNLLSADPAGSKVTLTWSAPTQRIDGTELTTSEIDSYNVYYSSDSNFLSNGNYKIDYRIIDTTHTVTGLTNNVFYYFAVTCIDTYNKESDPSNTKYAKPVLAPAPPKPTWPNTGAISTSNEQIQLTWNDYNSVVEEYNIVEYEIYFSTSTDEDTFRLLDKVPTDPDNETISYIHKNLTNGTTYYYYLIAVNDEGTKSTASDKKNGIPQDNLPPLPPADLVAEGLDSAVNLTWSWSDWDIISQFKVYRSTVSLNDVYNAAANHDPNYLIKTISVSSTTQVTSYLDINVANGTTYYYSITAVHATNSKESDPSIATSATPTENAALSVPQWSGEDAIVSGGDRIILNWEANPEEDIKAYEIWRNNLSCADMQGGLCWLATVYHPDTTYTDANVTVDNTYQYKLRAVSTSNEKSDFSSAKSLTLTLIDINLLNPSMDAEIQGTAPSSEGGEGEISLTFNWGSVTGEEVSYTFELSFQGNTHSGFPAHGTHTDMSNLVVSEKTTYTSYTFQKNLLPENYFYHWRVKAFNIQGVQIAESKVWDLKVIIPPYGGTVTPPPNTPKNFVIDNSAGSGDINRDTHTITLHWDEPDPSTYSVVQYNIYREIDPTADFSNLIDVVPHKEGTTSYEYKNTVDIGTAIQFYYKISAVDEIGQESSKTSVQIAQVYSANKPSMGTIGSATAGDSYVILTWPWSVVRDRDLKGYRIQRTTDTSDPGSWMYLPEDVEDTATGVTVVFDSSKTSGDYMFTDTGDDSEHPEGKLTNGQTYYYRLCTVNYADDGDKPGYTDNPDPNPETCGPAINAKPLSDVVPEFPSPGVNFNFSLTNDTTGAPKLVWRWSTQPLDVEGYYVYRDQGCTWVGWNEDDPPTPIANISPQSAGSDNTFIDTTDFSGNYGTKYCYRIKAYNARDANDSALPNEGEGYVPPGDPIFVYPYTTTQPEKPEGVGAQAGNGEVTVSWWAVSDVAGYNVYYIERDIGGTTPSETEWSMASKANSSLIPSGTLSFYHGGLTNNKVYYYRVTAQRYAPSGKPATEGPMSDAVSAVPQAEAPPDAPTWSTEAVVSGLDYLMLNWEAPTTGDAYQYNVWRTTDDYAGEYSKITSGDCKSPLKGTVLTCKDTTADDPSVVYFYRLTAVNEDGAESQMSEYRFGQPGSPNVVLYAPEANETIVFPDDPCSLNDNPITFTWAPVQGASHYRLDVASQPNMGNTYLDVGNITVTAGEIPEYTWDDNNWKVGSAEKGGNLPPTLYWRVTAYNANNVIINQSNNGNGQAFNLSYPQ